MMATALIMSMIEKNAFDLGDFKLRESSEQGMLSQVQRLSKRDKPVVFLGWEPHPMNSSFKLTYLSGRGRLFWPLIMAAPPYIPTHAQATPKNAPTSASC